MPVGALSVDMIDNNESRDVILLSEIANSLNATHLSEDVIVFDTEYFMPKADSFPMRIEGLSIILCRRGSGRVSVDLREHEFKENSLLVIQPKNYIQILEVSHDFQASFLVCSLHVIEDILPKLTDLLPILIHHRTEPVSVLSDEDADALRQYYSFLKSQIDGPQTQFTKKKIICLLQAALFEMMEIQARRQGDTAVKKSRKEEIMAKFILAVGDNFRTERQVAFYADKLCITPKHLSAVVKEISGQTAGAWIENYVIMEAKLLLKTTDLTIQQIAMDLNFSNQSFFGKYFKHITGMSPSDFRRTQQ